MEPLGNDRWRASFPLSRIGRYEYSIVAWVDRWETWRHDLAKRVEAGQDVTVDLQIGAADRRGRGRRVPATPTPTAAAIGRDTLTAAEGARRRAARRDRREVSRSVARDDARATADGDRRSGARRLLRLVRALPALGVARPQAPRHVRRRHRAPAVRRRSSASTCCTCRRSIPIGRQFRKGPNNRPSRDRVRPGRARGRSAAPMGGHTAIHPELGDSGRLRSAGRSERASAASRSRSTSPSRPRPTTRG